MKKRVKQMVSDNSIIIILIIIFSIILTGIVYLINRDHTHTLHMIDLCKTNNGVLITTPQKNFCVKKEFIIDGKY